MFKNKKKKTSFEPGPEDLEEYSEHQHEPSRFHHEHHEQMGRLNAQQILNNLASSSNDFAAGIALCVKALVEATAAPPANPIVIEYRSRRMAFGRKFLARMDGLEAIRMAARAIYPQAVTSESQRFLVEAVLFGEDGRVDRRALVTVDLQSWGELLPYIHSLYLRNEASASSPRDGDRDRDRYRDRDRDRDRDRYRDRDREKERERPRHESISGAERREDRPPGEPSGIPAAAELERNQSQNEGYPPAE